MRLPSQPRLATSLLLAQVLVVAVGAITPVIAAAFVAPQLFHQHLMQADVTSNAVTAHAEAAFRSALGIAVTIGLIMSLIAAGAVSWFLVRRIAAPIEELAHATREVAAGMYDVTIPTTAFSSELTELADSFDSMARRLATAEGSRTRMLADLGHEVRTPLATLQAYVDGLEDGVIAADAPAWDTMRRELTRLKRLADDIRAISHAEEQPFDLQRIDGCVAVEAAVRAFLPSYRAKQVALVVSPCAAAAPIVGDAIRLQQVLGNLLDNALRHTPPRGSVTVSATVSDRQFRVQVVDTGEGIPVSQLETVFERLHRVDPARASTDGSGSGLGLTIARAIVHAHGGTIQAHSEGPGTGASFVVVLPLAELPTDP